MSALAGAARRWEGPADPRRIVPGALAVVVGAVTAAVAVAQPIVIVGVVVALVALVVADRPAMATPACVGLVFSNAVVVATTEHGVPQVAAAVVPLLLLVTIGHRVCIERRPLVLPRATPWLAGLLVVQLVGAAGSREPVTSLREVTTFVVEGALLWLLLVNAARTPQVLRACAIVLVVVAALLALASLARELGVAPGGDAFGLAQVSDAVVARDEATGQEGRARHAGPVGEQNRWAQCLAVVVPLGIALAARDRSRLVRITALASLGAIAVGIVLTYSRGATLGLLLAALVALALKWVPRTATLLGLAAVVLVAVVAAPVFVSRASTVVTARGSATGQEAIDGTDPDATDGSFENRAVEASAAIAVFVHHPLVGVGPGLFPTYFQDEARRLGADRIVGVDRQAHNLYLGLAADSGVLGLVAFGGVLVTTLGPLAAGRRRLLASRPDLAALATGYAMALVVYLTTGLFLHFAYIRYFWLVAGLGAAMGLVAGEAAPADTGAGPVAGPVRAGAR